MKTTTFVVSNIHITRWFHAHMCGLVQPGTLYTLYILLINLIYTTVIPYLYMTKSCCCKIKRHYQWCDIRRLSIRITQKHLHLFHSLKNPRGVIAFGKLHLQLSICAVYKVETIEQMFRFVMRRGRHVQVYQLHYFSIICNLIHCTLFQACIVLLIASLFQRANFYQLHRFSSEHIFTNCVVSQSCILLPIASFLKRA